MSEPNQHKRQLHLIIPGLLGSEVFNSNKKVKFPELESFLARADRFKNASYPNLETTLFSLFGIDIVANQDLPVAAVTRVLDMGVIDQGWWLRADPVNLSPERDSLVLTDSQALNISQQEADRLVSDIMEVFVADGWILKAPRPDRWYLKPREIPEITTTPLPDIVGHDVHAFLPGNKEAKIWHTILNEVQILLHTADTNSEREARGELPINSMWFWGGGQLPEIKHHRWHRVWADDPVSLALARLSTTSSEALPQDARIWLQQADAGEHLVVLDQGRYTVQYLDENGWRSFIQALNQNWITPVLQAVKESDLENATIYTETGAYFYLTRHNARRWWRRRHSVDHYRRQ